MNENFNINQFKSQVLQIGRFTNEVTEVLNGYKRQAQDIKSCIGIVDGGKLYQSWENMENTLNAISIKYLERKTQFLKLLEDYANNIMAGNEKYHSEVQNISQNIDNIDSKLGNL